MEENDVETMHYDRANLETCIVPVEDFLDVFMAALKKIAIA